MGSAYLNYFLKTYAFTDITASNAPVRKIFDWERKLQSVVVQNPKSQVLTLDPGASFLAFSSARSTSIDNTTEFDLTVSPVNPSIYRFTWSGTGTAPAFRVDRSVASGGKTITVTRNTNATATFVSSVAIFGSVLVGDTVFIPGVSTGDVSGPFNILNEGFWVVLAVNSTTEVVLARLAGQVFSAASEVVSVATNNQFDFFSAAGVQIGDQVQISTGFSTPVLKTFIVTAVTPTWFEINSASPLPEQTAVPTATGMLFYYAAKKYLRIEADQQVVPQINGSTDASSPMITPFAPADPNQVGWFELVGPVFSLTLLNKSIVSATIEIFTCE